MKTKQEWVKIINDYENDKNNPNICGNDTLIKFLIWFEKNSQIKQKE